MKDFEKPEDSEKSGDWGFFNEVVKMESFEKDIDNELSPQESVYESVRECLSKDGEPLETQVQKCVDALIVYQKQKEDLLDVVGILQAIHNSTLRQIGFFRN